ncbi:SGNH/GDSL hydrolase family protein [Glutamicibacter ectropisis]|uniref:SGNH/GDSL hydrolase family protein n=1 Tax=Glutamicibacter ectropisis TaxID=3046593 RepID=A0AAU6WGB3_9MICC
MAWVTITNVKGPKGDKGDPGLGAENALQFKTSVPAGDVSTWTGLANAGIYRVPTQTQVNAITGIPLGAGPGNVLVSPVGSTTSTVTWMEYGDDASIWDRTVSTDTANVTGWVRRVKTKRVGTSLTLTGGSAAQTRTDFGGRLPVNFGVDIPRWRAHIRNYNLRDSNAYTGVLTITALSIGEAEIDAFGQYTGNWIEGTQQFLQGGITTPSSGSEVITNFFDYQVSKEKAYLLSYAFTGGSGQMVVEAQGGGFVLTNGSAAVNSVSTPSTMSKTMPLMFWIEAEVPEATPVKAVVGDSLSVGVSATLPVHDSWLAKLCRAEGALPMFWAASGDTLANFANDLAWKFHQWKALARPDVTYFAMGSNDIFGSGASLATMKQRFYDCWLKLRAFAGPNVVLCSIFPRFNGSAPEEAVRKQYNEWLETSLPGGASYFIDMAMAITNPDGSTLSLKYASSSTDIHLTSQGYARVTQFMVSTVVSKDQRYVVRETAGRTVSVWDYLNNREQLIYGDTGVRDVSSLVPAGITVTNLRISRTGRTVNVSAQAVTSSTAGHMTILDLPLGFRPDDGSQRAGVATSRSSNIVRPISPFTSLLRILDMPAGTLMEFGCSYTTADPWPTTLPGSAVGTIPYQ